MLGGPTPLWVSTYTSCLLYKVSDPFSAYRQSNGQNNFFLPHIFGRTSLCFTNQETQEESVLGGPTPLWVSPYTSYLSCTKFQIHLAKTIFSHARQGQNNFFLCHIFGRTSLCFTDQETQEEKVLGGPTPLWASTYTSYLLYKVPDPFSTCRQSNGQNNFFSSSYFLEGPVFASQTKKLRKRKCLVDQLQTLRIQTTNTKISTKNPKIS